MGKVRAWWGQPQTILKVCYIISDLVFSHSVCNAHICIWLINTEVTVGGAM